MMDYIYKDLLGNKQVGEIEGMDSVPYYEFVIKIGNRNIWCHLKRLLNEWHIGFIELEKSIELAHPRDVLWNSEALSKIFDDDVACRVAYSIKFIYDNFN